MGGPPLKGGTPPLREALGLRLGKRRSERGNVVKKLRQNAAAADAGKLIDELKGIDFALVRLVDRTECMTIAAAGTLVGMHLRLRNLRYQIETERARLGG